MGWKLSQILNNARSNTQVLDENFALFISKIIWPSPLNVHTAISILQLVYWEMLIKARKSVHSLWNVSPYNTSSNWN